MAGRWLRFCRRDGGDRMSGTTAVDVLAVRFCRLSGGGGLDAVAGSAGAGVCAAYTDISNMSLRGKVKKNRVWVCDPLRWYL